MAYETLLVEKSDGITTVTLNRPEKLNAFNDQMFVDLLALFEELKTDLHTRFVIFAGAGRAFSAGVDVVDMNRMSQLEQPQAGLVVRLQQMRGHNFMRAMENLEQITIAAVNGMALGGALCLVMACDFRVAAEDAVFGIPEANVGTFFTWGATPRLVHLFGAARAKEMILTCENMTAQEAFARGFLTKVVPAAELMSAAREVVAKIADKSRLVIRMTKKIANAASAANFGDLYLCEPELVERVFTSGVVSERTRAFLERKKR